MFWTLRECINSARNRWIGRIEFDSLMYNWFKLNLCEYRNIQEFVSKDSWKGARAYLLADAEVLKLVKSGTHTKFNAKETIDGCVVVQECMDMIENMHATMKKMKWTEIDDHASEEEDEYYAGDGDIESDEEFEKVGEDSSDEE